MYMLGGVSLLPGLLSCGLASGPSSGTHSMAFSLLLAQINSVPITCVRVACTWGLGLGLICIALKLKLHWQPPQRCLCSPNRDGVADRHLQYLLHPQGDL